MLYDNLISELRRLTKKIGSDEWKPKIFDLSSTVDQANLKLLLDEKKVQQVVDFTDEQTDELFLARNATQAVNAGRTKVPLQDSEGVWVYYPWRNSLVHILNSTDFLDLKTNRNRNLLTPEEQKKLGAVSIGFAGLNVGNPGAVCCALEGIGADSETKLADFDPLSVSNLNRFRASLSDLGVNKSLLTAQQMFDVNPFLKIEVYDKGIQPDDIESFLLSPKIDVLVEETDNLKLKIAIREVARKNGIPVVMVTGNGPNVVIDIERFDLDQNTPLLNGLLNSEIVEKINTINPKTASIQQKVLLARDFMGKQYLTEKLNDSFLLVGTELSGIPQLSESSFARGAAIAGVIRELILHPNSVKGGRYIFGLDSVLIKE